MIEAHRAHDDKLVKFRRDTLFAEISDGGTMKGPMGPKQATGRSHRTQGAFRFDFSDGKLRSILSYWDTAAMAQLDMGG